MDAYCKALQAAIDAGKAAGKDTSQLEALFNETCGVAHTNDGGTGEGNPPPKP